jgi:hypothetical protein
MELTATGCCVDVTGPGDWLMSVWDGGAEFPKMPNRSVICHLVPVAAAITTATATSTAAAAT